MLWKFVAIHNYIAFFTLILNIFIQIRYDKTNKKGLSA